jgi:hypothetical protein
VDQFSGSGRCVFGLWDGWGWIHGSPAAVLLSSSSGPGDALVGVQEVPPGFADAVVNGPRLHLPGRDYLLFTGPIGAAQDVGQQATPDWFIPQSPNLIWPLNRSWVVVSEIDFDSTLVAGSSSLIASVLAEPKIEAWPIELDASLTIDAETINV